MNNKIIKIKNIKQYNDILNYTKEFIIKENESNLFDSFIYTVIPINMAIKYNLLYNDFLLHPLNIKTRKFYEETLNIKNKKELINKINEILEYELTNENNFINENNLKKIIHIHKKLTKV